MGDRCEITGVQIPECGCYACCAALLEKHRPAPSSHLPSDQS